MDNNKTNTSLKCPRCDSSNTKFCYYNNYSLSQPRHFCKACKRYWTRGGTLRNVPVGGGCRKNKRVHRHSTAPTVKPSTVQSQAVPLPNSSSPMFYGLQTNPLEVTFPFTSVGSARVSSDLVGGLGFSSGEFPISDYKNGFNPIQDHIFQSSNSISSTFQHQKLYLKDANHNQIQQINATSDPISSFVWSTATATANFGSWLDPSSSVPSLI